MLAPPWARQQPQGGGTVTAHRWALLPRGGGQRGQAHPAHTSVAADDPAQASVLSPYWEGSIWLKLYFNAAVFDAGAMRTPMKFPSLVIIAGRVGARPRGQPKLGSGP